MQTELRAWTVKDSIELYNVNGWGRDFFTINEAGNVEVTPAGPGSLPIDLKELVDDLRSRGLNLPLLIRFSDILRTRVEQLFGAFRQAIAENEYKGGYRGVYPIKVNQQRHVVEELIEYGRPYNLGIEAGSKPELLVALALQENPEALILCNGYKDRAFIETALLAQKLGRRVVITIDRIGELDTILAAAAELDVRPVIGVRARLTTKGAGKWVESTGDRSKFGLTTAEIVATVERLARGGDARLPAAAPLPHRLADHEHPRGEGRAARGEPHLRRAPRPRREHALPRLRRRPRGRLRRQPDELPLLDQLHAAGVRGRHREPDRGGLQRARRSPPRHRHRVGPGPGGPPLGARLQRPRHERDPGRAQTRTRPGADEHPLIHQLWETYSGVSRKNFQEAYHDALQIKEEAITAFNLGVLDLKARARVEELFWATCEKILKIVRELPYVPDELEGLEKQLSDTYYCNFSLFQSMPDHWAVKQLFPTMPDPPPEQAARRGAASSPTSPATATARSTEFIDLRDVKDFLELHSPNGERVPDRVLPGGGLPGDPGRPAQPVRRHRRGARAASTATTTGWTTWSRATP